MRARRRPRRRCRAEPDWCTGSAARARCRGGARPGTAAASMTCSQLSRMTSAEDVLSRSKRAASPPGPFTAPIKASTTSSAVTAVSSLANQMPSIATPRTRQPAADRDRDRRLPDASWSHDLHEPPAGEQVGQDGHLRLTTDELGRHRRQVPGRRCCARRRHVAGGAVERGVVEQDPLLELLQRRSRVQARARRQLALHPLVRRQGVRLAPGSVQRGDRAAPTGSPGTGTSPPPPPAPRSRRRRRRAASAR